MHVAGTPSIRWPIGPGSDAQCSALRAEAIGHDVSIRSYDQGRFERTGAGVDLAHHRGQGDRLALHTRGASSGRSRPSNSMAFPRAKRFTISGG